MHQQPLHGGAQEAAGRAEHAVAANWGANSARNFRFAYEETQLPIVQEQQEIDSKTQPVVPFRPRPDARKESGFSEFLFEPFRRESQMSQSNVSLWDEYRKKSISGPSGGLFGGVLLNAEKGLAHVRRKSSLIDPSQSWLP